MPIYDFSVDVSTRKRNSPDNPRRRAAFARGIAHHTFGPGSPRADTENFRDRPPGGLPRYWLDACEIIDQSPPDGTT